MHQRYNKWETEHILSSLEQIECLWGVSIGDLVLAPEGGAIAWALVIFFSPIHYKDASVICDPFPPSSWERRLELDLNTIVFLFFFPRALLFDLDGNTSWGQENVKCAAEKSYAGERYKLSAVIIRLKENLASNEKTVVWADTWIESHL